MKKMRKLVDVLTLTATPIPRTLHMAMLGIRDLSVIQTAPPDRQMIRTFVAHFEDGLVREVILRELNRGGPGILRAQPRREYCEHRAGICAR